MRRFPAILAIIAGFLLILARTTGSTGIIGIAIEYAIEYLEGSTAEMLYLVLQALSFIANLGGVAVIAGGILIYARIKFFGRFIIGIGAGMGLIGFIIVAISVLLHGWAYTVIFFLLITQSLVGIGIVLAVAAMLLAR